MHDKFDWLDDASLDEIVSKLCEEDKAGKVDTEAYYIEFIKRAVTRKGFLFLAICMKDMQYIYANGLREDSLPAKVASLAEHTCHLSASLVPELKTLTALEAVPYLSKYGIFGILRQDLCKNHVEYRNIDKLEKIDVVDYYTIPTARQDDYYYAMTPDMSEVADILQTNKALLIPQKFGPMGVDEATRINKFAELNGAIAEAIKDSDKASFISIPIRVVKSQKFFDVALLLYSEKDIDAGVDLLLREIKHNATGMSFLGIMRL